MKEMEDDRFEYDKYKIGDFILYKFRGKTYAGQILRGTTRQYCNKDGKFRNPDGTDCRRGYIIRQRNNPHSKYVPEYEVINHTTLRF